MKYVPPYGMESEPDAPYINGDPSVGRMGSIPPAAAFENPMRELVNVITYNGLVPDDGDLAQVAEGVRSQRANYVEDTGSVNNLSVALKPPLGSYSIGLPLRVKVLNTNTGVATINAGAGTVPIKKPTGAAVAAGDLPAGGLIELVYDGSTFQMINFGGAGGTGGTDNTYLVNIPYCVDTGTTNAVVANFSPALTSLVAGDIMMVKMANTNTTQATINVNGLGPKNIFALGGYAAYPLLPNDMAAGDVCVLTYDGTHFWVQPNINIGIGVTFNVSTTAQINDVFTALGRKQIQSGGSVTVQLATGIYQPFATYHNNADRISVVGTMLTSIPNGSNFYATGSSAAARAQDSANNIAMLRTRYGTEIRFDNTLLGVGAVQHRGPGGINFVNLLITGQNVAGANAITMSLIAGIGCGAGSSCNVTGCSVWGSGGNGIFASGGTVGVYNSFACGCWANGMYSVGGLLGLQASGSFGNAGDGLAVDVAGIISTYYRTGVAGVPDVGISQSDYNGGVGADCRGGSQMHLDHTQAVGNASFDAYAVDNSSIIFYSGSAATASPVFGSTGNSNSVIKAY
jgi:hypothetical protein